MSDIESDPQTDPEAEGGGHARETDVQESDPNADSAEGLAGDMGISSERVGPLRGSETEGTYGAMPTHPATPEGDVPPEQSSDGNEILPDPPVTKDHGHPSGT